VAQPEEEGGDPCAATTCPVGAACVVEVRAHG
jgi:hypothetical protein